MNDHVCPQSSGFYNLHHMPFGITFLRYEKIRIADPILHRLTQLRDTHKTNALAQLRAGWDVQKAV
jgi:hypothetical protein